MYCPIGEIMQESLGSELMTRIRLGYIDSTGKIIQSGLQFQRSQLSSSNQQIPNTSFPSMEYYRRFSGNNLLHVQNLTYLPDNSIINLGIYGLFFDGDNQIILNKTFRIHNLQTGAAITIGQILEKIITTYSDPRDPRLSGLNNIHFHSLACRIYSVENSMPMHGLGNTTNDMEICYDAVHDGESNLMDLN